MFAPLPAPGRKRTATLFVSVALHCLLLIALLRAPEPQFVKANAVMWGERGASHSLIYLARRGAEDSRPASAKPAKSTALTLRKPRQRPDPQPKAAASEEVKQAQETLSAPRAGSPYGSLASGPLTGVEVKPALPVVFPDPVISRSEIPDGVRGNVIVEVTIDERGLVVATRVLQGLGHGIEEKVVAAVRNWRFRPATRDGVPIPSQQDVCYHFPS